MGRHLSAISLPDLEGVHDRSISRWRLSLDQWESEAQSQHHPTKNARASFRYGDYIGASIPWSQDHMKQHHSL